MPDVTQAEYQELDPLKFRDPNLTGKGENVLSRPHTHKDVVVQHRQSLKFFVS
jgi:hypothetical protein